MSYTKTYKILEIGKPTINDRVYPKEVVQKALDSDIVKEALFYGGFPVVKLTEKNKDLLFKSIIPIVDLIGLVKSFNLTDDGLFAKINFINDNYPENIFALGNGDCSLKDSICYVDNYELICLYIEG